MDVPACENKRSRRKPIWSEDVTYEVSKLSETIEPLLLGLMGVMVGVLLLGVFSPLWNLGQATLHPGK
jgi:MSHA biogenesis protein MshG